MTEAAFPAGQWSEVKLIYLGKYLSAYLAVIMKKFPKSERYYVDLFAGPGIDEIRPSQRQIDGSPLRAMSLKRGNFTKYIFVENKPSYFQALLKRVSAHNRGTSAEVISGDCNELVHQIVQKIPQGSPVFLFVDPRGLDVDWQTIQQFAAHRHLDMLMTFPYDLGIKRCAYDAKSYNTVDRFYGTSDWREIAKQRKDRVLTSRQARDAFAELYVSQLRRIGLNFSESTLLRTKIVSGKPLYHMIFASRYFVALDIWRSITSRQVGTLDRFIRDHQKQTAIQNSM
ncbi:MAG: three-Cys-motif partner protein TcmP [Candidatus Bathyarchaeia archaeon]